MIHNNASSSEKVPVVSHIHIHIRLELFWLVNSAWSVQISLLIQTRTLFKNILMMDFFLTIMQMFVFSRC